MNEYISRKKAIKAIEALHDCYNGFSDTYDKACIIGTLEEIPAAPVREVKRGRWITEKRSMTIYPHRCSECGASQRAKYDYCPNCGADMREDSDDKG